MTLALCLAIGAKAQGDSATVKLTTDVVSNYIWRGTIGNTNGGLSFSPNFQPTVSLVKGPFEIGVWASSDFAGKYYETDIFATLALGPVTLGVNDYYFPDPNVAGGNKYFEYGKDKTAHMVEATINYKVSEAFPLNILVGTMLYGNDKKVTDISKQNYSTYMELSYAFKKFSAFIGATPSRGYYGAGNYATTADGFNVVNLGLTTTKSLKITDSFSLPLKGTIGWNTQAEFMYVVFGVTL